MRQLRGDFDPDDSVSLFRPFGACSSDTTDHPRLVPWAELFRRLAAAYKFTIPIALRIKAYPNSPLRTSSLSDPGLRTGREAWFRLHMSPISQSGLRMSPASYRGRVQVHCPILGYEPARGSPSRLCKSPASRSSPNPNFPGREFAHGSSLRLLYSRSRLSVTSIEGWAVEKSSSGDCVIQDAG